MDRLVLIVFLLSLMGCARDRTINDVSEKEYITLLNFQKLQGKNRLQIADTNEPGAKLRLCLTFIDKESKRSLPNQLVKFYHTTANGNYEQTDPNDESTARLNGQALTTDQGQMYIETILPGDYGTSSDNRHIHTTVFGAKPEAYDIHFKQYTSFMGKNFAKGSDQHFLADLKITKENVLVVFLTIEVKKPNKRITKTACTSAASKK